ncbi:apolipoprotein N-acyltransferase, partial [Leucobacter sp. M11]|uniref:apolipoprotein N-acyltransferase n=1 Tax=Leucobacter sp. M11 TaxID=2993565 RepID=UPI002D8110C8
TGAAFWFPHISWLTLYLGLIPWLALGTAMTIWVTLLGLAIGTVTRWLPAVPWRGGALPRWLRVTGLTVAVAALWTAKELGQSTLPYGGFSWGRIAHTQSTGPFATLAGWLGFAGLSCLVVALVALPIALLASRAEPFRLRGWRREFRAPGTLRVGAAWLLAVALLMVVPTYPLPQVGETTVAAVQGNADAGIFADRKPGDIFEKHALATERIVARQPDLIVWPENAGDLDLRRDPFASSVLRSLSERADAPILTGTILRDRDRATGAEEYFNSLLLWEPGLGLTERYDKRFPVPFAEYMPNRDFFHAIVPDLVDLVRLNYTAGTRSPVLTIGGLAAGVAICFDIVFDDQAQQMIDDGAQILLAPTNNADFGRTDQSAQQLEIARLRAIETGRVLVNVSTVGTSAVVLPSGVSLEQLEPFTADTMVQTVPLYDGKTPAMRFGEGIAGVILALAFALLAAATATALSGRARIRRERRAEAGSAASAPERPGAADGNGGAA